MPVLLPYIDFQQATKRYAKHLIKAMWMSMVRQTKIEKEIAQKY